MRVFPSVVATRPSGPVRLCEPFTRGLVCAFAPGLGAGLQDLVSGLPLAPENGAVLSAGGGTFGLICPTSAARAVVTAPSALKLAFPLTVVARLAFQQAPPSNAAIFEITYDDAGTTPFVGYGLGGDASAFLRLEWNSAGTFKQWAGGASYQRLASTCIGAPITVAGLFDPPGVTIYFNGDEGAFQSASPTSTPTYTATSLLRIGQGATGLCLEYGLIYNRRLTPNELALFRANPYHWAQPASRRFAHDPTPAAPVAARADTFLWLPV